MGEREEVWPNPNPLAQQGEERHKGQGQARAGPVRQGCWSDRGAQRGWYKGREQHVGLRRGRNRALGPGKLSRGKRAGGKS